MSDKKKFSTLPSKDFLQAIMDGSPQSNQDKQLKMEKLKKF